VFLTTRDVSIAQKILLQAVFLYFLTLAVPHVVRAEAAAFDLVGPRVEMKVSRAGKSLRNLRVAEVVQLDLQLDAKGKVEAYRAKLKVSFKFEG